MNGPEETFLFLSCVPQDMSELFYSHTLKSSRALGFMKIMRTAADRANGRKKKRGYKVWLPQHSSQLTVTLREAHYLMPLCLAHSCGIYTYHYRRLGRQDRWLSLVGHQTTGYEPSVLMNSGAPKWMCKFPRVLTCLGQGVKRQIYNWTSCCHGTGTPQSILAYREGCGP